MSMEKCSHPECLHVAEWISNIHCNSEHHMSRKEVIEKFGEFEKIGYKIKSKKKGAI